MTGAHDIVRIKISLDNVKPTVMRRIEAPVSVKRKFRADNVPHLTNLCRMAVRWATDNLEQLRKLDAPVPAQLHDRQADNWRAQFSRHIGPRTSPDSKKGGRIAHLSS